MSTSNRKATNKSSPSTTTPQPKSQSSSSSFSLSFTFSLLLPAVVALGLLPFLLYPQNPISALFPSTPSSIRSLLSSATERDGAMPDIAAMSPLNGIPHAVRAHWMRRALSLVPTHLGSPCPFAPFVSVVVNHTAAADDDDDDDDAQHLGREICVGANAVGARGNPVLHGEIAAINNCTDVLAARPYGLSPAEIRAAWPQLAIYTTGEPCPMCAAAIRWAGFRECVYASSVHALLAMGWPQIAIRARELFARSDRLGPPTALLPGVESDTADPLFAWQFASDGSCPHGCSRRDGVGACMED